MLQYKLKWREADLIETGRFDPSSKTCSKCGNIKRDLNAAINIRNIGMIKVGKGIPELTPVESATAAEPQKEVYELPLCESGTSNTSGWRGCQLAFNR